MITDQTAHPVAFDIECGAHTGTILAHTPAQAWAKLTEGKSKGFARLVRWRLRKDNGKVGSVWHYQTPQSLEDELTALTRAQKEMGDE